MTNSEKNQVKKTKKNSKKRKINIKKLIKEIVISLIYLVIFGGIGVFFAFNSQYGNPDKTVSQVYENYAESNWMVLFDLSNTKESTLVNQAVFANVMSNKYLFVEADSIKQTNVETKDDVTTIKTEYNKDGEKHEDALKLVETQEKKYMFFPTWELDLSDMIIENVSVKVPHGFEVTLDGIDISNLKHSYIPQEDMTVYYVDRIFAGTHALICKQAGMQDVSEYIELNEDGAAYNVPPEIVLMEEEIKNGAPEIVFGLYKDGFEASGCDNLMDYFNEEGKKQLQSEYDELYAAINQEDGAFLKIIENVEYEVTLENGVVDESVDAVVNFKCTFWAKTPRTNTTGIRKDYEGSAEDSVVIHYVKSGDKYIAQGMDFECIDYRLD